MIELAAGGASDVGRVRSINQDSWLVADLLWAVADGMGGHLGGEVASQMTIDVLADEMDENSAAALTAAAKKANAAVHQRASEESGLRGMGTTLCAMALVRSPVGTGELAVINVGDSRCYQWRDGELTQITRDHSLVEDMRVAGQITEEEAAVHPHRNIVTRALGIQPDVEVDEFVVVPKTGDRYVLCSDGLFNEVAAEKIGATLRRLADPDDCASELIRQANENGGRDNITCVIVDVVDDDGSATKAEAAGLAPIRRRNRVPDVAGIGAAVTVVDDHESDALDRDTNDRASSTGSGNNDGSSRSTKANRRSSKERDGDGAPKVRLRRATWRTLIFVIGLLAILGVAACAVGLYSRGSYFVGYGSNGEVTIFKGRPEAVLWFNPTVTARTGIAKSQVPQSMHDDLVKGKQQSTRAGADAYITQMRSMICANLRNGAVPPATTPSAPTTTLPAKCANLSDVGNEPSTSTTSTTTPRQGTTTTKPSSSTTTPSVTVTP